MTAHTFVICNISERHKWDEDFSKWRVVEKLDTQLDIFQYVCNSMAPQPSREYITLRYVKGVRYDLIFTHNK